MNQNYQHPPPMAHHPQAIAPELSGPPPHLSGYSHQLPPMAPAPYYQNPNPNMHPPNMPIQRSLPGSRDHIAEMGPTENGASSAKAANPTEKKDVPPPKEIIGSDATRKYQLKVVQHPQRARMCGFGDKDRRPITPPPCIRLIIMDRVTGKEVDCNEIDHQHYVLHVDLWDEKGEKEYNLVKHTQNQSSIGAGSVASFREVLDTQNSAYGYPAIVPSNRDGYAPAPQGAYPPHMAPYQSDPYAQQGYSNYPQGPGYPQQVQVQQHFNYPQGDYRNSISSSPMDILPSHGQGRQYSHDGGRSSLTSQANGMYTRNLIGSLACSAARLTDPSEKIGIWFVLQDMSVRTEGFFRLRFSFINLRSPTAPPGAQASDASSLVKGKAKVLAQVFSEPFQVYSAKKFPGVCESTPLSKCFASQGVKIPIRKEAQEQANGKRGQDGSDDED